MAYLFVLNVCSFSMLVSNGTVSSMILITLASEYWMTRSGRADVTRTSGGMVSPLSDLPTQCVTHLYRKW